MKLRGVFLFILTLAGQRALATPGLPAWCTDLQLLTVWLVVPALQLERGRSLARPVAIGLCWDALQQPIIGPGGIAWSASALVLSGLAGVVADRSYRMWAVFGAVAAIVIVLVHALALWPLGLAPSVTTGRVLRTALLSGLWCGLAGAIKAIDFPKYWRTYRVRRLR